MFSLCIINVLGTRRLDASTAKSGADRVVNRRIYGSTLGLFVSKITTFCAPYDARSFVASWPIRPYVTVHSVLAIIILKLAVDEWLATDHFENLYFNGMSTSGRQTSEDNELISVIQVEQSVRCVCLSVCPDNNF